MVRGAAGESLKAGSWDGEGSDTGVGGGLESGVVAEVAGRGDMGVAVEDDWCCRSGVDGGVVLRENKGWPSGEVCGEDEADGGRAVGVAGCGEGRAVVGVVEVFLAEVAPGGRR